MDGGLDLGDIQNTSGPCPLAIKVHVAALFIPLQLLASSSQNLTLMPLMWNSYSARCIFWTAPRKVGARQMTLVSCRQAGSGRWEGLCSTPFHPTMVSRPPWQACLRP